MAIFNSYVSSGYVKIAMERSAIFIAGKIHYFDWAIFNGKLLVITRG